MLQFQELITHWYHQNKRNLPWRTTKNAYVIWLSEIILQQTRVEQGLPYFNKFLQHYPSVSDLATADEQEILNDWQGLGYYSRARNLHKTAKEVVEIYKSEFPSTYNELLKLTGIGPYTAAAIASFAFDEAKAVVDGNVYRVLSRVFDIEEAIDSTQGKKTFELLANELIDKKNPAIYNQAIMEFGALHCVPVNPDCATCPLQFQCLAYANKTITERPVKSKKTKVTPRYFVYLIELSPSQTIRIEKRKEKGIWQHLYQFPLVEFTSIDEKKSFLIPHLGSVIIGNNVLIGSNTVINKGTIKDTVIGNNVKIDDCCFIAHNCIIKENSIITATSEISGSCIIEENSWIGPGTKIIQKVVVGKNSIVGIGSIVRKNISPDSKVQSLDSLTLREFVKLKKLIS